MDAQIEKGEYKRGRDIKIKSVTGYQMTTQCFFEVRAKNYCDSSGDSILAPLCGANFRQGREAADEFGEDTTVKTADSMTMGMSCLIQGRETVHNVKYIPPKWSTKLSGENFKDRNPNIYKDSENFWYLELGGDRNTIDDTELLRHELIGLATGTWDYIKNSGDFDSSKWDLDFLGFLPGKRESRRMCGEYMITQRDISDGQVFDDEIAFGGWPLDDHFPGGFYHKGTPNTDFSTPAPYSLPLRALYSENVENLFFAGRNISMTHMAMSSIRVMATCALLGEAVGKAAALAARYSLTPHEVYLEKLDTVQRLLMNEDCFLPSKTRKISEICKNAKLNVGAEVIRNGQDRAHRIYETDQRSAAYFAYLGESITYSFEKHMIGSVHIVFCSDLNRDTLTGGNCERTHNTRANQLLDSPQLYMPKTLCREFKLIGEAAGKEKELLYVKDNRKRAYHIELEDEFDKLTLVPLDTWGDTDKVAVISFDFE
jgi:hypothetical protein